MRLIYSGGHDSAVVVLPERELKVCRGELVDVSDEEAEALAELPDFEPAEALALTAGDEDHDEDEDDAGTTAKEGK